MRVMPILNVLMIPRDGLIRIVGENFFVLGHSVNRVPSQAVTVK